jgi:hypothetical protein
MKKMVTGLLSFSLLCLLSAGALADHKDLKEHITISQKIWVNGTEVKPGSYLVRYDAASSEMKLERNGKVIAQAKATVVVNNEKFDQDALLIRGAEDAMQLTGVRLGGQYEEIQLVEVATSSELEEDFDLEMWQ